MTFASVALLVDGDNISSTYAGQILRKTKDLGPAVKRLVYGNMNTAQDWSAAPSFRMVLTSGTKNGADILLSVQAMEFALRDGIEAFAIASSDSDFTHVAYALRELGRHVVGLGKENAPKSLRFACSNFVVLKPAIAQVPEKELDRVDRVVRNILLAEDANRIGILLTRLNEHVRKDGTIKISDQPEKKWPKYLAARPELYELIGEGKDRRVRIAAQPDEG